MKKIEETFYSYATGNIYYTIQKNYNEVKSSTSLVCAVFNFLKSNMQNTLHPSSFSRNPLCLSGFQRVMGAISPFIKKRFEPQSKHYRRPERVIIDDQ